MNHDVVTIILKYYKIYLGNVFHFMDKLLRLQTTLFQRYLSNTEYISTQLSTILGYTGRFDFPQQSGNSISFAAANMQQ